MERYGYSIWAAFVTLVLAAGGIGWILNIVKLVRLVSEDAIGMTMLTIVRISGIPLAPLGAVAGWVG